MPMADCVYDSSYAKVFIYYIMYARVRLSLLITFYVLIISLLSHALGLLTRLSTALLITLLITYDKIVNKILGLYSFIHLSLQSLPKRKRQAKSEEKNFFKKSLQKIWRVL